MALAAALTRRKNHATWVDNLVFHQDGWHHNTQTKETIEYLGQFWTSDPLEQAMARATRTETGTGAIENELHHAATISNASGENNQIATLHHIGRVGSALAKDKSIRPVGLTGLEDVATAVFIDPVKLLDSEEVLVPKLSYIKTLTAKAKVEKIVDLFQDGAPESEEKTIGAAYAIPGWCQQALQRTAARTPAEALVTLLRKAQSKDAIDVAAQAEEADDSEEESDGSASDEDEEDWDKMDGASEEVPTGERKREDGDGEED